MPFVLKDEDCIGCGVCFNLCPYDAISEEKGEDRDHYKINNDLCMECSMCANTCPVKAIAAFEKDMKGGEIGA